MRLSCQEQLLPPADPQAKWELARDLGFDGIELRGHDHHRLRDRLPRLVAARDAGAVYSTVCVEMDHFIGDFDADRAANAVAQLASQLEVIAELGGEGVVTPASWGMFSRRLPPHEPPRSEADDRQVLVAALRKLGAVAEDHDVRIMLEPLNRYEDHMVNTIAAAGQVAEATGSPGVGICADTFHMNIEERTFGDGFRAAGDRLGLVQVSDSSRLEPGTAHLDWPAVLAGLAEVAYDGWLSWECRLSGAPEPALRASVAFLRDAMDSVGVA